MRKLRKAIPSIREEKENYDELGDASWDIKRIGVGLLLLVFLFLLGLIFLPQIKIMILDQASKVLGVSFSKPAQKMEPPDADEANRILQEAKEGINKLTVDNFTSSTSAISNIIRNLQLLQKGDLDTKEAICEYLCKQK